jgi:hypothetical protein
MLGMLENRSGLRLLLWALPGAHSSFPLVQENFNTFLHHLDFYKQNVLKLGWHAFLLVRSRLLPPLADFVRCLSRCMGRQRECMPAPGLATRALPLSFAAAWSWCRASSPFSSATRLACQTLSSTFQAKVDPQPC